MLTLSLFLKVPPHALTCTALVPGLDQGQVGHDVSVRASVQVSEKASVRVQAQLTWAQSSSTSDAPTPQHPLPAPLMLPCLPPAVPGPVSPTCASTGAAAVPPQHLPPLHPGLEPAPAAAAGGRPTAPTPQAPALPQPGESGCFPVCLLPFALILGTGYSDSQAAVPAGTSPFPLTPLGYLTPGIFQGLTSS